MHYDPKTTLQVERRFAVSAPTLWRCLTEPDLIQKWFAPQSVVTRDVVFEAWAGGSFRSVMEVPGMGEMPGHGCVLLAEPWKRLIWTDLMRGGWQPNAEGLGFIAIMDLIEEAGGTLYRATALHGTETKRAEHERMGFHQGWGQAADQLGALALTL